MEIEIRITTTEYHIHIGIHPPRAIHKYMLKAPNYALCVIYRLMFWNHPLRVVYIAKEICSGLPCILFFVDVYIGTSNHELHIHVLGSSCYNTRIYTVYRTIRVERIVCVCVLCVCVCLVRI